MNHSVTTLRMCKICNSIKDWNEGEKLHSKASGWMGNICWSCHVQEKVLKKSRDRRSKRNGKLLQEVWK